MAVSKSFSALSLNRMNARRPRLRVGFSEFCSAQALATTRWRRMEEACVFQTVSSVTIWMRLRSHQRIHCVHGPVALFIVIA